MYDVIVVGGGIVGMSTAQLYDILTGNTFVVQDTG